MMALSFFVVAGGMALLFPWRASHGFVSEGWPCAALELAITIPAVAIFWLLARRGALFRSAGLGAALTGLAVFVALTAVEFQCMFPQAAHVLVWHGGTAAILVAVCGLLGQCGGKTAAEPASGSLGCPSFFLQVAQVAAAGLVAEDDDEQ